MYAFTPIVCSRGKILIQKHECVHIYISWQISINYTQRFQTNIFLNLQLEWELPEVFQVEGGPTDPPPVTPEPNFVVTPPPSPSPLPSPSPSPNSPRKRQVDTEDLGMGPGDGDGPVPEPLGDIVAIYGYMGEEVLDTYAARPGDQDVMEFKVWCVCVFVCLCVL